MKKYIFEGKAICSEFNIGNLSREFGINRKIKWEEALILKRDALEGIFSDVENKMVYIYYFGAIVFVNFQNKDINAFIERIRKIPNSIKSINKDMVYDCTESFEIIVDENSDEQLGNEELILRKIESYHLDITALVVAKSVALETIEKRMDVVFDEVEKITDSLKRGKLDIKEKKITSIIGRILSFKYNTISYIMLLDKPDITWDNESAEKIFNNLADLFELNDRYENLSAKSQILLDTTEIFANLSHSRRANILEIIIIVLILIEVIMAFGEPIMSLIK
ncbi:hypothetical protein CPJCM30710_27150 [Clostridium polyendosporum]|uniref:DUF155 domain-containing protein n=1 Tax=Clostridium polyendosporum TaxID=69208 RepID=A0A919S244_9CLOT|nr:RMD1 family protein [Clostridium polyendosporum]GIM30049.1 hypothetical protein CPJCM30710_27150 [Clostridium polyendosporum]